jgi:hypothetical protein
MFGSAPLVGKRRSASPPRRKTKRKWQNNRILAGPMRVYFWSLSWLIFYALSSMAAFAQDLDPKDAVTGLEQALPIAIAKAKAEFPDLDHYILYSVHPRVFKGDSNGLHWEFVWKAKAFPHRKAVIVRVYMKDGSAIAEREQVAEQH